MRKKRFLIFGIAFVFAILLSLQCSAYIKSSVQGVSPGLLSGGLASSGGQWVPDRTMCEAGQDFAVQIPPFGCEPAVVRSDLLEEQNTPIFCQLSATKMNPLISIDAIESISFSGKQLPPEISGVGFFPAQAALGVSSKLNTPSLSSPILNNIGYAVIVLKKQPNESAMPDVVSGNLTATLKYDIKNAYGIGEARFYLPEISDGALWERVMSQYGFWNGKGYLRADAVSSEDARISLYVNNNSLKTISLDKGETSNEIFLPGFDCFVGVKLKLEDLTAPNRRAILSINGNTIQLNEGEKFLDNKCTLVSSESRGLTKKATINCKEDQGSTGNFDLVLTPRVSLDIGEAKGGEYSTGDYLYDGMQTVEDPFTKKKTDRKVYVYLGYIGTKEDSGKLDDLYITLVSTPVNSGQKLSDTDIASYASRSEKRFSDIYRDKALILAKGAEMGASILSGLRVLSDSISKDKEIKYLPYKQDAFFNEGYFGKEAVSNVWVEKVIKITGFASPVNSALKEGGASSKYYTSASQDYSKVVTSFAAEKDPITSGIVLGEDAYAKNIILANILDQRGDIERLCNEFKSAYFAAFEKSEVKGICVNPSKQSSATSSTREVTINTVQKIISLEDVREPRFEDFGVRIKVTMPDKSVQQLDLIKDRTTFVNPSQVDNSQTYIKLVSINKDTIEVDVNRPKVGTTDIIRGLYESNRQTLKKGTKDSFGTVYGFEIVEIYDKKEAKVLVIPTVNRVQTEANFSFQIGIEKRAIQLSPEKTKEKIESLNKTISQWSDINEKLTKVVEGMKGACLATGLALTMKNFVNNVGGQSIARQEVMSGPGGWNQKCLNMVTNKTIDQDKNGKDIIYKTIDECIMTNAGKIDNDVNAFYQIIKKIDAEIKPLQEACKIPGEGILTEKVINTECLRRDYAEAIKEELNTNWKDYEFDLNGEKISAKEVLKLIDNKEVSIEDMRKFQLYAKAKQAGVSSGLYTQELNTLFADIYASNKQEIATANVAKELGIDASMIPYVSLAKEPAKVVAYNGLTFKSVNEKYNLCPYIGQCVDYSDPRCYSDYCPAANNNANTPVQYFSTDGGKAYLATLKQVGTKYHIQKIYSLDAVTPTLIPDKDVETFASKVNFEIMNQESYTGNTYKSSLGSSTPGPMLRCYETEPYKGYPAIAPVDTKNGWYVSIPQNLPAFGNIASFDASGRVMSFYICNVWEGGVEENRGGNDKCSQINLGISQPQVGGLDSAASKKLIDEAVKVVEKAQTVCKTGKAGQTFSLGANANGIKMGVPAANLPEVSCYNFMSPNDCKILFNVCDPVVCPSSRCDFGGKYPVKDVIQSGIIGSTLLCLPNFVGTGGDVYIPVCLSGIKAGLDGLLSVFKSYRDCLQESLDTGKMTGVCDEIHSIYLCDFFWKQTLPLAKMIVPKTIELIMGKSVRGGGEYMSVQDAWTTAGQSMDYFAQYYAADAYTAFKARITQEVTDAVCKTYISGAYPDGGKITDSLTQASSPPQYYGRFDEMTYTTATNPPISQYKVFYHIYAGENSRAYYQVYLTEAAGSSYYQDTSTKLVVDTGYIEQGGTSDQTKDFTAVSGYKKMCIIVNGKEDCGFKQVTSSFALDYVADQYVKEQINQTDITTESACNSGTSSAWSLVSPSVQGAAGELVSPQLYNRGVIRICANDNPGAAMDKNAINPRWIPVGYCGQRTLKCWLDTQSVKDAVNWNSSVTNILSDLTSDFLTQMKNEGKYFTEFEFKAEATRISKLLVEDKNFVSVINSVNAGLSKASMNSEKGKLYILRAQAYGGLANAQYTLDKAEAGRLTKEAAARAKELADAAQREIDRIAALQKPCVEDYSNALVNIYYYAIRDLNQKTDLEKINYFSSDTWGKEFIDRIYANGNTEEGSLITLTDYNSIKGNGLKENAKSMADVKVLLVGKYNALCITKGGVSPSIAVSCPGANITLLTAYAEEIDYFKSMDQGIAYSRVDGIKTRIDNLRTKDLITGDEYNSIRGTLGRVLNIVGLSSPFGLGEKTVADVLILLKSKYNALCAAGSAVSVDPCGEGWVTSSTGLCVPKGKFSDELFKEIMIKLKTTSVGNRKCLCGDNCETYADKIIEMASQYGFDKLLFLSLMMQESNCNSDLISSTQDPEKASVGLMQISLQHCGKYDGLPSDKTKCKNELISNPLKNMEVGAQILSESYETYKLGIIFNGCTKSVKYTGWDAALRGYNGIGCGKDEKGNKLVAQDSFVEDINTRYIQLVNLGSTGVTSATSSAKVLASYSDSSKPPFVTISSLRDENNLEIKIKCPSCSYVKYGFWTKLFGFVGIPTDYEASNTLSTKNSEGIFSEKVFLSKFDSSKDYYVRIFCYDKNDNLIINEFDIGSFKVPVSTNTGTPSTSSSEQNYATFQYDPAKKALRLSVKADSCTGVKYDIYSGAFGMYVEQQDSLGNSIKGQIISKTGQLFVKEFSLLTLPSSTLMNGYNYYVKVQCYDPSTKKVSGEIFESTYYQASGTEKV
ncbi:MAG: transglycosylase SLT domain-containing protein [archaeon]